MLKNKKIYWVGVFLSLGWVAGGCGTTKQINSTQVPVQPEPSLKEADLKPAGHYVVKRHDCLWTIAEKPQIYGDPFQWPLLFKANRDLIADPDLIYPRQKLKVENNLTAEERDHAKRLAMDTPAYSPHRQFTEKQLASYF